MKPWKIQKFFGDLIYDMRSRGLLPLAGLLLAAMIAVPMYLGSQGSDVAPQPAVPADQDALAPENQAAVVKYEPGVRDYKKRIADQSETDPFIQQFTPSSGDNASLEEGTGKASGSGALTDPGSTGGGTPDSGGTTGGSAPSGDVSVDQRYYYYEAQVAIGEAGQKQKRINVKSIGDLKPLPSKGAPMLLFVGVTEGVDAAVFSVSRDVVAGEGDGFCDPSPENCARLIVPEGKTVNLVYAFTNKAYKVTVREVELVVTKKQPAELKPEK